MTRPTTEQIAQLTHAELSTLVKELIVAGQRLEAENRQLKAEWAQERPSPPRSDNSSQPPSRDVKRNLPADRTRKKLGSPFGHARQPRSWVAQPDRIIEATGVWCGHCHAALRGVALRTVVRHQLTEWPPITPVGIETRQPEVLCPACQRVSRGELPAGREAGRGLGPRLVATVVYLKHEQPLS
jgi:hypothetical protein